MASSTNKSIVDRSVIPILSNKNHDIIDASTPSRLDEISTNVERQHRLYGTQLIWCATKLLKVNASTYATACCIFHRFYYRVSLSKYCIWSVVMGSLLLGTKIEDGSQQRTIREIIIVTDHLYRKRVQNTKLSLIKKQQQQQDDDDDPPPPPQPPKLIKVLPLNKMGPVWKDYYEHILEMENRILRELGFTLYWIPDSHPHKFLWEFLKVLFGLKEEEEETNHQVIEEEEDQEGEGTGNNITTTKEEKKKEKKLPPLPQQQQQQQRNDDDDEEENKDSFTKKTRHHHHHQRQRQHELLAQRAWNYCNDSCRLDLCVRYNPEVITCAAIHLAACDLGLNLLLPLQPPKLWWELFLDNHNSKDDDSGSSCSQDLSDVANAILGLRMEYKTRNNNKSNNSPSSSSYMEFLPSLVPGGSFNDEDSFLWESRT